MSSTLEGWSTITIAIHLVYSADCKCRRGTKDARKSKRFSGATLVDLLLLGRLSSTCSHTTLTKALPARGRAAFTAERHESPRFPSSTTSVAPDCLLHQLARSRPAAVGRHYLRKSGDSETGQAGSQTMSGTGSQVSFAQPNWPAPSGRLVTYTIVFDQCPSTQSRQHEVLSSAR